MNPTIENILTQFSGKTFYSNEGVNDFFRKSLETVFAAGRKAGLEEALGAVSKEKYSFLVGKSNAPVWNACRKETIKNIKALIK